MITETDRLIIRKIELQDASQLEPILGDPLVMKYSLKGALDVNGITQLLKKNLTDYEHYGYGIWGIILKETGEFVGIAGLLSQVIDHKSYVELAYRLAHKHWSHGFAAEAANGVKEYAFKILGIEKLISIIEPTNVASVKVAQRVGMTKLKSARFHGFDVDVYHICK